VRGLRAYGISFSIGQISIRRAIACENIRSPPGGDYTDHRSPAGRLLTTRSPDDRRPDDLFGSPGASDTALWFHPLVF
jgi:hypothetical protein